VHALPKMVYKRRAPLLRGATPRNRRRR
jgi:hypothetical protein